MKNNTEQFPLFLDKDIVIEALGTKIFSILFYKKDGTQRKMLGKLIPSDVHNSSNDRLIRCIDVIKKRQTHDINLAWRQFDLDNVISITCQGNTYHIK
jgi:hypothetical protein